MDLATAANIATTLTVIIGVVFGLIELRRAGATDTTTQPLRLYVRSTPPKSGEPSPGSWSCPTTQIRT